jgi:addiction module HigA family antidote
VLFNLCRGCATRTHNGVTRYLFQDKLLTRQLAGTLYVAESEGIEPSSQIDENCLSRIPIAIGRTRTRRSVALYASALGVARKNLYAIIKGEYSISVEMALSKAFDTTPEFWLQAQMNYDLAKGYKEASKIKVKRLIKKVN